TRAGRPRFRANGPALLGGGGLVVRAAPHVWRRSVRGARNGCVDLREELPEVTDLLHRELLARLSVDFVAERVERRAHLVVARADIGASRVDLRQQAVLRALVQIPRGDQCAQGIQELAPALVIWGAG